MPRSIIQQLSEPLQRQYFYTSASRDRFLNNIYSESPLRRWHAPRQRFHNTSRRSASTSTSRAPTGDRPLLNRDPNRPLPSLPTSTFAVWSRTLPLFAVLVAVSSVAIFNYQKQNSSVISSTLYALRRNETAREMLGDEIYFASSVPWISGQISQLHGKVDVKFWVKGTKGKGRVRFWCERKGGPGGLFETREWSLQTDDGQIIHLLDEDGINPML